MSNSRSVRLETARMSLSEKRKRFVAEYLVDLNGTQAAIRAGYSAKTANEQAARLLANVSVREEVQKLMDQRATRLKLTADEVIEGIRDTIERCRGQGKDFQPFAALKGLELLGKHLKLFTDRAEFESDDAVVEILKAGRRRRAAAAQGAAVEGIDKAVVPN